MLFRSDFYTTSMQADARLSLGGADAVVVPARPSEGGGPLDDTVIARLSDLDGVASVRGEHWDIIYPDLPRQLANAVGAIAARDVPVLSERTTLTAGRLPQGPEEVATDTTLAKQQELGVDDPRLPDPRVQLDGADRPRARVPRPAGLPQIGRAHV